MQSNQDNDFGSLLNNFSGSTPQGQTTDLQDFGSLLNAQSTPQQPKARSTGKPSIDAIMAEEGADHLKPVISALYGQETDSGATQRTSINGARGGMQIMPDTFRRYARAGERIDDPTDNMRVGVRIIKTLGDKFNNDPSKIATAYFSGDGNVNSGDGTPWKHDRADGNGKRVSSYVSDVVNRIGGGSGVQLTSNKPTEKDPIDSIPDWKEVEAKSEYQAFTPTEKQQAKEAYFDRFIAPVAGSQSAKLREQFMAVKVPNEATLGNFLADTWEATKGLPGASAAAGGALIQGNDPTQINTGSLTDEMIKSARARAEENAKVKGANDPYVDYMGFKINRQDIRNFPQNAAFSVASMGASLLGALTTGTGVGLATGGVGAVPAGIAGGAAAGGAAAYRMDTNSFMRDLRDSMDKASVEQRGTPLSNDEFVSIAQAPEMQEAAKQYGLQVRGTGNIGDLARAHGAHEAGWEALGNTITMGAGKFIIKEALKGGLIKPALGAAGVMAGEVATETPTQMGQHNVEVQAGLNNEPPRDWTSGADWKQSFEEVAGPTALTSLVMGGGAAAYGAGKKAFSQTPQTLTPDGRLEQNANGQPATAAEPAPVDIHPTQSAADQVVQEAVDQFGVPDHVVASELTPQQTTGKPSPTDDDVTNFAESRLNDLLRKRDGTIETVIGESGAEDQEVPGVGLSNTEQAELDALFAAQGEPQTLRKLYGFDQTIASDQSQLNTQGNVPAPETAPTSQPEQGQTVPNVTELALEAAQDEESQRQTQELGLTPSASTSEPIGGSIGTTEQPQPAVNPASAQNDVVNPVGNTVQQDSAVQTNDTVNLYDDIPDIGSPSNVSEADGMRLLGFSEQEIEEATSKKPKTEKQAKEQRANGQAQENQAAQTEQTQAQEQKVPVAAGGVEGVDAYTARNEDRIARAKKARSKEELSKIVSEEYADNNRHFEGTQRLEIAAKDRQEKLDVENNAADQKAKYESGEWVTVESTGSKSNAENIAKENEQRYPENEYRTTPSINDGWAVQKRKKPAAPKTEKEARAKKDYSDKWFGSQDKAQAFIEKQGIGASHEFAQDGKRFLIKAKQEQTAVEAPVAAKPATEKEAKAAREEKVEPQQPTPIDDAQAKAKADFEDALGDLAQILTKNTRMNIMPEDEQRLLPVLTRVMDAAFRMGYYKFKDNAKFVLDTIRSRMGDEPTDQITIDHLQGAYIAMAGKYQEQGASKKREVIDVESIADLSAEKAEVLSPEEMGKAAFHAGLKAAPVMDKSFQNAYVKGNSDTKAAMRAMDEWSKGWHAENLAAPTQPTIKQIDIHTPEGKFAVAQKVADHLLAQDGFKTIVEARKFISGITGVEIKPATELAKQADETIETGVVLAAREIVDAGRKQGRSSDVIYDRLSDLYSRQPNLSVRTSESVRNQAYSTPAPLAYLASELAGVTPTTKLIESTAGNGMLAIGAATNNAVINELNPKRAAMLKAIGFDVTIKNAATQTLAPAKSVDAVVINPPFGATKDDNGDTIIYEVKPNYGTREIDHAIVFKTLEAMKDDGKAVLIVGGVNETDEERRRDDYRGKNKRAFYYNLYNDYNVVDHFTVDGKLYTKQGASYPVDVIVIDGRGKSARDLPAAALPQIISSYEELKGKLNGKQSSVGAGVSSTNGVYSSASESGASNVSTMGTSTVGQSNGTGTSGNQPSASNRASVPVSESTDNGRTTGSGTVSSGGKLESTGVSERGNGQTVSDASKAKRGSTTSDRGNNAGELGGASVVAGERVGSGLNDRRGEEQETATQVAYAPHSGASSVGTLVPKAMRDAIDASLSKIEDQVGSIDQYVADNLDLDTQELAKFFSAEQVDALALAIRNAEAGRGFIIGDQTGIGKGRVVAAMIKYALVNDKTPIFVTEKPNLYADMIRDLDDIGMTDELGLDTAKPKVLITNASDPVPYTLLRTKNGEVTETNFTLRAPKSGAALDKFMAEMGNNESLGDYKVIFTTYSQLQTVKGKATERQRFIKKFGAGNYMIFDESHNAGGGGETQARTKGQRDAQKEGKSMATGRAAFVRELVDGAFGTFFSSATYAKRPDVMDLYSSTNMKLAVPKIADLGEAIRNGGVPMQQAVATMLTTDGQYIRRERTFAGVSYDTVETKVDRQTAENMASAMRSILSFSRAKDGVVKAMQKELDKSGGVAKALGEKTTVQSANFGSIMHNLIDQMLLSLKAKDSVNHAIERLKAGEKVVMTVSNTMGSFLNDYAKEMDIKAGDPVGLSFKDLYMRYLDRQRVVTIKMPNGENREHRLTDNELGPRVTELFNKVRTQIEQAGFGSAPISPIDYIHSELQKAGYKTDEITGRNMTLNYSMGTPVLSSRNSTIRQRVGAVKGFNNGDTDVIILNQAGSTGLSLHASNKVKDQRKRHMIIVQAEKNIDTHMQMLGRVHRTGQVIAPAYSQMMADIPAEMRPASVLMKKMASLSANTTASRKSSVTAEGVVDFMNDYGGQVVQEYVRDNPDMLEALGGSKVVKLSEESEDGTEEDIRKFTGYIPILPIKQQEEIYADLIDRYNELIERENALGTNKLEAKAVDLDAKTLSSTQITENKGVQSVFAEPANMEQVDVKRSVRPLSSAEVTKLIDERLDGKQASAVANEIKADLKTRASEFALARIKQFTDAGMDEITLGRQKEFLNATYNNTKNILDNYTIGDKISVSDKEGYRMYGVITDISNRASTANPAAGSSWKMHIAVANGESKTITLSFSQIGSRYILGHETNVSWYSAETKKFENMSLLNVFDQGATTRREKRWIVTGNLLAGYARHPGQIITYTKDDGTTVQGVLMNRQFDFAAVQKNAPVTMRSADDALRFLNEVGRSAEIGTPKFTIGGEGIRIVSQGNGEYLFTTASASRVGGTFFLDKKLTDAIGNDFYKSGKVMHATAYSQADARAALDYLINERGEQIVALTNVDKAKEMFAQGTIKPSRSQATTNPHEVASLSDRLRGVAGEGFVDALVGTGKFKVVNASEVASMVGNDPTIKAFYNPSDDTTYFVADNISKHVTDENLHGLLLHEIGVHAMTLGKDDAAFAKIKDQFSKMRRVSPAVEAAYARAEKAGTPTDEEALGYFVEANPKSSISQRLISWIKNALRSLGLSNKWTNSLSESDIIAMASGALRRAPSELVFDANARGSIRASYAGEKANNADKSALAKAVEMEQQGVDGETIRKKTGWFLGMDDKWRFEISDNKAKLKDFMDESDVQNVKNKENVTVFLVDLIDHPKLFESYPDLETVFVSITPSLKPNRSAYFDRAANKIGIDAPFNMKYKLQVSLSMLMHEVQHAIQQREGFAIGGNPLLFNVDVEMVNQQDYVNELDDEIKAVHQQRLAATDKSVEFDALTQEWKSLRDERYKVGKMSPNEYIHYYKYERLAGEIEARDSESRLKLTDKKRKEVAPYSSQGIAKKDAIVRFAGQGVYALNNDIRLLAPNGKPSNLNAMQYAQVRTPEFKAWFGDWENDPKNASKVVDENGEPLVVYHGTKADFSEFKPTINGMLGTGIYLTSDKNEASDIYAGGSYGVNGIVLPIFTNINNPAITSKGYDIPFDFENHGFDGVIFHQRNKTHYVASTSDQIKSATGNSGAFSKTNNDIRFSKSDERQSFSGISRNVRNNLVQFFGNQKSLKTWNAWDKTLATQYHKALKDKHYGKVFNLINAMQNEVSLTSIRPAELAPGVLPRVDDVKTAAKVLIKGKKADSAMDKAANALFAGTLAGENVMAGKVWTDEKLRNNFGLNDTGVALYKQARAAIDASLDEVAAAEGYAMAQGFIPKALRAQVINNPQVAKGVILEALEKQIKTLDLAIDVAKAAGNEAQAASLGESRKASIETITNVERIFTTARNLKSAGYAPLMRFGKFTVTAQAIDPQTGAVQRDVNGDSMTLFYGQYETEGEAKTVLGQLESKYANRDDVRLTSGVKSQSAHEMYAGISPETIALFAEAVGQGEAMKKYYQLALSERSALKRRLERKGIEGFSSDMPRVLSNFITSNGRFAAQRYYLRDINNAIKYIPKEKGDVLDEAIELKKFIVNPNDPAAPVSSALFAWFIGGSVASAVVNLSQPVMMTGPYLSQFGIKEATAGLAKALPYALGKKQITDTALKEGLKRASQEGIVDAQEIFHLYSVGAQGVASNLVNTLARLPAVSNKIKAGSESARARVNAFLTLWGSMFATAESFNRKLTFIAAWDVAKAINNKKPYEFAVRAVNETQGIYNKVNRPNWARGPVGRVVMTFKQYSIMYAELLSRMYKHGGPEGKRAALIMLGVLMLAAGEEGLPFAQDLDDLIDTLGQAFGLDTNMRRNKRRVAHELLGEKLGELFLYGISSQLPIDFAGRMGMGNLIPGTSILKPSDEQGRNRQIEEVFGAGAGMIGQIGDAYDAATEGNWSKAGQNLMPMAIKNVLVSAQMASKGYATDTKGRKVVETTGLDAVGKAIGFNPTKVAEENRRTAPIQQDIALQKKTESSIVDQWAMGVADNDQAIIDKATKRLSDWNESNPKTPITINNEQIRDKARQFMTDKNTRLLKKSPREMRGGVGLDLVK